MGRRIRPGWGAFSRRGPIVALVALCLNEGLSFAEDVGRTALPSTLIVPQPSPVRDVRVLVVADARRLRVRAADAIFVESDTNASLSTIDRGGWVVVETGSGDRVRVDGVSYPSFVSLRTNASSIGIELSVRRGNAWSRATTYPNRLQVSPNGDGRLDVVNAVDVERYVAGVVANEVWPTFHREAFRAQAIAARTFVLFQMKRRQRAAFDVTATQGAQVYRGVRTDKTGRRAVQAAIDTQGLVCTWRDAGEDRLFSTYYSAACGGRSQSASIFGPGDDVPPLRGGVACDDCRIAPGGTYRWGPVTLSKAEIRARLAAAYKDVEALGAIESVRVIERNDAGRPVRLRVRGSTGDSYEILAERFRLAIGGGVLRSTDFELRDDGRNLVFENGRGWGHGLGLCQWGTEGQARSGKTAGDILRSYYPGSTITRVY